jgi:hypothetical protein
MTAERDYEVLSKEAEAVGLRLDEDDLEGLVAYARFLEAKRAIQAQHLKALKKGVNEPILELPFLFSAGLALPDVETLADVMEERIEKL